MKDAQQATKPSSSGGGAPHNAGGGSTGGSGGSGSSGGGTSPPPPGPMSAISVTGFSASSSPHTASSCLVSESVTFSVNGSGSVSVVWKALSTKTTSSINNPIAYSFSAAGSQTDGQNNVSQGLEPGDSYRVSVTITDQANGAVVATGGPTVITSCAGPKPLLSAQQPSNMTNIAPGTLSVSQNQDGIFANECSMVLQAPFSVEAVYTITSGSSGGATLYAASTEDFTGPRRRDRYVLYPYASFEWR